MSSQSSAARFWFEKCSSFSVRCCDSGLLTYFYCSFRLARGLLPQSPLTTVYRQTTGPYRLIISLYSAWSVTRLRRFWVMERACIPKDTNRIERVCFFRVFLSESKTVNSRVFLREFEGLVRSNFFLQYKYEIILFRIAMYDYGIRY